VLSGKHECCIMTHRYSCARIEALQNNTRNNDGSYRVIRARCLRCFLGCFLRCFWAVPLGMLVGTLSEQRRARETRRAEIEYAPGARPDVPAER